MISTNFLISHVLYLLIILKPKQLLILCQGMDGHMSLFFQHWDRMEKVEERLIIIMLYVYILLL